MELKLVYRILRKISDWTIAGYYSEVYVEDQDIITDKDPVIMYVAPLRMLPVCNRQSYSLLCSTMTFYGCFRAL